VDPCFAQHLVMDPGSMSILTHHRATRCIGTFNISPWRLLKDSPDL
jgi:probable phosphoglycerate mutase